MMLMAVIKHRTWIHDIEDFLRDKLSQPPELDMTRCQFAGWLNRLDTERWSKRLRLLSELHKKVHQKARQLVTIKNSAGSEPALARLHELHVLGDTMLRALREFVS